MRPIIGCVMAVGLVLGLGPWVYAQSSPGEYGGFPPAGNTNASSLGANLGATYGMNPNGFPTSGYNQPNSFYGANYVLPPNDSTSPSYYTYGTTSGQPASFYGANYNLPLPGGQSPVRFNFGPTSGQPTSYYGSNYSLLLPGNRFTYTGAPVGNATGGSSGGLLPGVTSYTRAVPPGVAAPRGSSTRANAALNGAPSTIAPGGYFTPRLR